MFLITSAAYVEGDFVNEIGLLPPSFLPVGNKRLFEYQIPFLKNFYLDDEDFYLSIPISYKIDAHDIKLLNKLDVKVLKVPDGLSLGKSILYSFNATGKNNKSLTILHGDTLFINCSFHANNFVSIHSNRGFYKRASLGKDSTELKKVNSDWSNNSEAVISGFFRFSNPLFLMKSLVEENGEFIESIIKYHQDYPLSLISEGEWLDFGHINSFYHSRTRMTTQRAFNQLNIDQYSVSKSSKGRSKKIYAEGNWFDKLPLPLRLYTPALLDLQKGKDDFKNSKYDLEYLYLLPLSDLLVFGRNEIYFWEVIFNSILNMLKHFSQYNDQDFDKSDFNQIDNLYLPKTQERLEEFNQQQDQIDVHSTLFTLKSGEKISLSDIAIQTAEFINPANKKDLCISHGDLCFSNILFDARVENIKCIDPRGISPFGDLTLYGDQRYDLAKLYHSVVGFYDFIIANRFDLKITANNQYILNFSCDQTLNIQIIDIFRSNVLNKLDYSEQEILAITIHLFLSMLPLHNDQKTHQKAFIANSIRLYENLYGII